MDRDFILTVVLDEQKDNNQNWKPLHQCLLMLFDSPLNHYGALEVYIRLAKDGRLIKLHREVRIPRTFKRFEQLFINFLQGCEMPQVQTKDGLVRLFQFICSPIDKIFPSDCPKFRISNLTSRLRGPDYFTETIETSRRTLVFIEFGPVDFNFLGDTRDVEYEIKFLVQNPPADTYSISRYPMSPANTCVKLLTAFEQALEVF